MRCVVYVGSGAAIPSVEKWCCEYMHKLFEREAFSHSARIQGTELKNNFLLKISMAFCVSLV